QGLPPDEAMRIADHSLSQAAATAVLDGGRQSMLAAVQSDSEASGWMRLTKDNPCSFCELLSGRIYPRSNAGFAAHNNCVIGSTVVDGPSTEVAYRRWYEGEIVVFGVAGGD